MKARNLPYPFLRGQPLETSGADLGGGYRGCTTLPEMTYGFLIQLVFRKKCDLLVLVTPFLSGAPPPKKILDLPLNFIPSIQNYLIFIVIDGCVSYFPHSCGVL